MTSCILFVVKLSKGNTTHYGAMCFYFGLLHKEYDCIRYRYLTIQGLLSVEPIKVTLHKLTPLVYIACTKYKDWDISLMGVCRLGSDR